MPFTLGGDYNLDRVCTDHPIFLGSSLNSVYSSGSPADGIFIDNHRIGCGAAGLPATAAIATDIANCDPTFTKTTPNTLFSNSAYPRSAPGFMPLRTLGQ